MVHPRPRPRYGLRQKGAIFFVEVGIEVGIEVGWLDFLDNDTGLWNVAGTEQPRFSDGVE